LVLEEVIGTKKVGGSCGILEVGNTVVMCLRERIFLGVAGEEENRGHELGF